MNLSNTTKPLIDIELGGTDAESDPDLSEYFLTTPIIRTVFGNKKYIILGRKGSGKSSIFTQMPRIAAEENVSKSIVQLFPDDYAWKNLKDHNETGISKEHAHTNAWLFTIAIEVGLSLINLNVDWNREASKALENFKTFLKATQPEATQSPLSRSTRLLSSLKSFNFNAFGFGMGATVADGKSPSVATPHEVATAIFHSLIPALEQQPHIIALDRLDDAWDGSENSKSILIGLLKAAKDLNDKYKETRSRKQILRVVLFLRTDIYESLSFDDKDKHRPYEEQIIWDESNLAEMVNLRLPERMTFSELFPRSPMRGSTLPKDYMLKRTFLRPREVLQFLGLCLSKSGPGDTQISKEVLKKAEITFSNWKVEDLKQEYSKSSPNFPNLIEAFRQGNHRYDSKRDLLSLLQSQAHDEVQALGEQETLKLLLNSSAIGVRIGNGGAIRYKSTAPELSLPPEGTFYVHQALHKGLNITETRAPRDDK